MRRTRKSGWKAALLPDGKRVRSKLLEDVARQEMTLDGEGVVDRGTDRQQSLR